ncbi:MAG: uncharacterized protein PWQ17_1861 [Anaerophaga sp.]|uniref:PepSY-associated TM helix domain-containing protein n=1 Tax=Anaerophaga thermohalophila TaxID=177400 RepID=UPI000237B93A|nr:PepSY-associated TM helix domain-containing protein [Anaerophaga thermohalophila]MDK2842355.1 uncharacterized protein [Anaerophaga sp.]MDN5290702.1 uncharacterized protein [Anaerophaga sp.]
MQFNWRKINRVIHRDLGYFFTGMIIIYGLSGIALNHIDDWNPNYIIEVQEKKISLPEHFDENNQASVLAILEQCGVNQDYKNHYSPSPGMIKIFLEKGSSVTVDTATGIANIEIIRKRPVFYEVNFLHYNPGKLWTWFSDIFAFSLMILAITGLFILKGKNGIRGRGAWLSIAGILISIAFLVIYL